MNFKLTKTRFKKKGNDINCIDAQLLIIESKILTESKL
jgi:hypothetical protein